MVDTFSRRYGHAPEPRVRNVREDAPEALRTAVFTYARKAGRCLEAYQLAREVCLMLPDASIWSEVFAVGAFAEFLAEMEWYRVYDLIEALCRRWGAPFEDYMNKCAFPSSGVAWELKRGKLVPYDPEGASFGLEDLTEQAASALVHPF